MSRTEPRIVIVAPCRNEERFLPDLIRSLENQTLKPVECIIVDDGSTDKTPEIVSEAEKRNSWLRLLRKEDRGKRSVGPGVVETFYYGYDKLRTKDWDYICKLDGDIILPPNYFKRLIYYFEKDKYLGSASGKLYLKLKSGSLTLERTSDEMVWGCTNFYRRECFDQIGGFVKQTMWDGIAFHRARMAGWRTRSIWDPELKITEQRIMGSSQKNIIVGRIRWGRGQYFMGTHPIYILAVGFYRLFERPFLIGGICIALGYFISMLKRAERYDFPGFRKSLHAWQFERLKLGKRLEKIPDPPENLFHEKELA